MMKEMVFHLHSRMSIQDNADELAVAYQKFTREKIDHNPLTLLDNVFMMQ